MKGIFNSPANVKENIEVKEDREEEIKDVEVPEENETQNLEKNNEKEEGDTNGENSLKKKDFTLEGYEE